MIACLSLDPSFSERSSRQSRRSVPSVLKPREIGPPCSALANAVAASLSLRDDGNVRRGRVALFRLARTFQRPFPSLRSSPEIALRRLVLFSRVDVGAGEFLREYTGYAEVRVSCPRALCFARHPESLTKSSKGRTLRYIYIHTYVFWSTCERPNAHARTPWGTYPSSLFFFFFAKRILFCGQIQIRRIVAPHDRYRAARTTGATLLCTCSIVAACSYTSVLSTIWPHLLDTSRVITM